MTPFSAFVVAAALLAGPSAAQEKAPEGPVLKTDFQQTEAIAGQPLSLRLTVLVPTFMPSPPDWPSFEAPNLLVRLPEGSTTPTSETLDGKTWSGITRHYRISPMVPGRFQLPPQEVTVTFADPQTRAPVNAVLTTEAIDFNGTLPAGAEGLDPFVAAADLKLTQDVEGDPAQMAPGQSLKLTLSAEVQGVSPMFLPPLLPQIAIEGIAAYPAEPVVEERSNRGQLSGSRRESVTLVAEGGGSGRVPPVRLDWYSLETNQIETASVDGFDVSVKGPPAGAGDARDWWSTGLAAVAALAGLAVAALALRWATPRLRRWFGHRRHTWQQSEPYAFRALEAVVRRRDQDALRPALDTWAARTAGPVDPRQTPELRSALLALGAARYSADAGSRSEAAAWAKLAAALPQARQTTGILSHTESLPPLNPNT